MNPSPLISVVLPVYNGELSILNSLESLCAQTVTDWETLVIDDGSTDETVERIRPVLKADSRFRLIRLPHQGIARALQDACRQAKGDYIARMDADDECLPKRFEMQAQLLDTRPEIGLVSCRVSHGGDGESQQGYAEHVRWTNGLLSPEDHFKYRFVEAPVAHPSVMFRREVMESFGGYREGDFPEDYELWLRWLEAGVSFLKLPETGLVWNDPPDRLSRSGGRYSVDAFYRVKMKFLAKAVPTDRPLWLWGSGRVTRKRYEPLECLASPFQGFVDIDARKIGQMIQGKPVVSPEQIPVEAFVICGVGSRGAREKMEKFLKQSGRVSGRDYLLGA